MSLKPINIGSISLPAFDVGGAILALVTFGAFEMGMVGIAKLMKNDGDNFGVQLTVAKAGVITKKNSRK